jgi:mannosyltransferase
MSPYRISWELVGIVLVGCSLRLYGLDAESFWRDEVSSVNVASLELPQIIANRSADVHPPLYYFLLHYWIALWGSSAFAVRSLSSVCGILAIWPMYRIGTLLFNHRVGLLSALGLALSEFQIQYSQEAKGYSLMGLLTVLSFVSLLQMLRQHGRFAATRYVLSTSLLMYTHVYALFVVISQSLYYFFVARLSSAKTINIRRWLLLQGALFLAYLPWVRVLCHQISTVQEGFWFHQPTVFSLWNTFVAYSGSRFAFVLFLSLVCIAVFVKTKEKFDRCKQEARDSCRGCLFQSIKSEWGDATSLLMIWLLTPLLVPFVISLWTEPIYLTRGTIGAAFAFHVVVARGVDLLSTRRSTSCVLIGVVVVVSFVNVMGYYRKMTKEQWRDVAAYIDVHVPAHAVLLFSPSFCQRPFDYYSHRNDLNKHALVDIVSDKEERTRAESQVELVDEERVWVIACDKHRTGVDEKHSLMTDYLVTLDKRYIGITLLGFLRKEP